MIHFLDITTTPALLYLDPGTGSMILQMVLAAVAGTIVFLKYQGHRLVSFFKKSETPDDTPES